MAGWGQISFRTFPAARLNVNSNLAYSYMVMIHFTQKIKRQPDAGSYFKPGNHIRRFY
jgi:hypothetical protein